MLDRALRLYFVANVALLVVIAVTLPLQRPGTAAYFVTVVGLAVVASSVLLSGAAIYLDVDLPGPGGR